MSALTALPYSSSILVNIAILHTSLNAFINFLLDLVAKAQFHTTYYLFLNTSHVLYKQSRPNLHDQLC